MTERLRVGLVGGGIGQGHADAYRQLPDEFELAAVCDLSPARIQALVDRSPGARVVANLDELCRLDEVDVVDLCTPSHLHAPQALQALAAGKHVICEKPVAGSLREVDQLTAAEAASGRRLMPIFQYRFGHGLQKLKWLRDHGLTGAAYLTTVETAWRRRADYYAVPWRGKLATELGGALVTHAIHAHDALYYILGPARRASAYLATRVNPIEGEDCVAAALEMADGSLATLAVTLGSAHEITRHRFCFSRLVAESNTRPYSSTGDPWSFTADEPEQQPALDAALAGFTPGAEGYVGQFSRFYAALRGGGELPVTLAEARASLELVTALSYSSRTGQAVSLPLAAEHPFYAGWRSALGPHKVAGRSS